MPNNSYTDNAHNKMLERNNEIRMMRFAEHLTLAQIAVGLSERGYDNISRERVRQILEAYYDGSGGRTYLVKAYNDKYTDEMLSKMTRDEVDALPHGQSKMLPRLANIMHPVNGKKALVFQAKQAVSNRLADLGIDHTIAARYHSKYVHICTEFHNICILPRRHKNLPPSYVKRSWGPNATPFYLFPTPRLENNTVVTIAILAMLDRGDFFVVPIEEIRKHPKSPISFHWPPTVHINRMGGNRPYTSKWHKYFEAWDLIKKP